jgi:hypothetical protein
MSIPTIHRDRPLVRSAAQICAIIAAAPTATFAQQPPADTLSLPDVATRQPPAPSAQPAIAPTPPPAAPKPAIITPERPGFGDTTSIVAPWRLQLETGLTFTLRDRDGVESQTFNAPEVLARLGIIEDRLEFRLGTSGYVWSRSNTGPANEFESTAGFSDLFAGIKLKLLDQRGPIPRLVFEAVTTVGTGSRSVSNRDLEPTIKLIGSWDLGSGFSLTSNAIATYASSGGQRFIQGAGSAMLSYTVTDSLSLFVEYYVVGPRTKGTDAAHSIDFGGAYLLNERIQLDARLGFGLNNQADNFFVGTGISLLF